MPSLFSFWDKHNCFKIEKNELKKKEYIYTTPLKVSRHGLKNNNLRPILISDAINKYLKLNNKNTNYSISINDVNLVNYKENKEEHNMLDDKSFNKLKTDLNLFNIGYSSDQLIRFNTEKQVLFFQKLFLELYELGYIKYSLLEVTKDNLNSKIYDKSLNNKNLSKVMCFYLDFSGLILELSDLVLNLPIPVNYRDQLLTYLNKEELVNLTFNVLNSNLTVSLDFKTPELLGSLVGLFISVKDNSNYLDYVSEEELSSLDNFLLSDDKYLFTGNFVTNPLTGNFVPIFLSRVSEKNECLFSSLENKDLIDELGLEYIEIFYNKTLINSDFLNGLTLEEAKIKVREIFIEEGIIVKKTVYTKDKMLICQTDEFGIVPPISICDKLKPLTSHLPIIFSKHFRLQFKNEESLSGDDKLCNMTLNTSFLNGADFLLKILYDPNISFSDILSDNNKELYSAWTQNVLFVLGDRDLYNDLFVPLLFRTLFNKIYGISLKQTEVLIVKDTYDNNGLIINSINRNLFDLDNLFKIHRSDSIRLYFLAIPYNRELYFKDLDIIEYDKFIESLERYFKKISDKINHEFTNRFFQLENKLNDALISFDFNYYINELLNFYHDYLKYEEIKKDQIFKFLIMLFLVCPEVCEMLHKLYFNASYSLVDHNWK